MGEVLSHIRQLETELSQAMHEAGRLRGQLEAQTKLLEAADVSEQRRIAVEAERDRLRSELEHTRADLSRLPWWVRVLWLRRR